MLTKTLVLTKMSSGEQAGLEVVNLEKEEEGLDAIDSMVETIKHKLTELRISGLSDPSLIPNWELANLGLCSAFLKRLELSDCNLLPPHIQCLRLKALNLSGNKLTSLDGFETLQDSLMDLNLKDNQISVIKSFTTNLSNLVELNMSFNCLSRVPLTKFLSSVRGLDFSNNSLERFRPFKYGFNPYLRALNLKSNFLRSLPKGMQFLTALTILDISDNLIKNWPIQDHLPPNLEDFVQKRNPYFDLPLPNLEPTFAALTSLGSSSTSLSSLPTLIIAPSSTISLSDADEPPPKRRRINLEGTSSDWSTLQFDELEDFTDSDEEEFLAFMSDQPYSLDITFDDEEFLQLDNYDGAPLQFINDTSPSFEKDDLSEIPVNEAVMRKKSVPKNRKAIHTSDDYRLLFPPLIVKGPFNLLYCI